MSRQTTHSAAYTSSFTVMVWLTFIKTDCLDGVAFTKSAANDVRDGAVQRHTVHLDHVPREQITVDVYTCVVAAPVTTTTIEDV